MTQFKLKMGKIPLKIFKSLNINCLGTRNNKYLLSSSWVQNSKGNVIDHHCWLVGAAAKSHMADHLFS